MRALLAPSVPLEDGGVLVQSAALIAGEAVLYCLVLDLGTEGWRPRAIGLLRSGTGWVDDLRGTVTLDDDACLPGSVPLVWGFAQSPDHTPEIALEIALECPGRTPIRFEQTILVDPCQESRLVRDFLSRFPRAPRPAKKSVGDDPILLAPDDAGP